MTYKAIKVQDGRAHDAPEQADGKAQRQAKEGPTDWAGRAGTNKVSGANFEEARQGGHDETHRGWQR